MSDRGDHCECRFDLSDTPLQTCAVHAEMQNEIERLREALAWYLTNGELPFGITIPPEHMKAGREALDKETGDVAK